MPYKDGIPKIKCYSLTDFNDFESCSFRFFVRHHLDRKYEIDESSPKIALGNLLDQAIKRFHKEKCYGTKSSQRLIKLIKDSELEMRRLVSVAKFNGKNHFFEATIQFLTDDLVNEAIKIFTDYYVKRKGHIRPSLGEVGFCEYPIALEGDNFKLWGGPDCLELGEDGIAEVVDYKSRQDIEKGKANMDISLMSKIYVLLCTQRLLSMGYRKARFVIRFWQDPLDESFFEEFDVTSMNGHEFIFRQKIEKIVQAKQFELCGNKYCAACKSEKKQDFLQELEKKGYTIMSAETFMREQDQSDGFLPF